MDGIAIVGMAVRFPGARNVRAFWDNLVRGAESMTVFSEAELAAAGVSRSLLRNPAYVPVGAPLAEIDRFDAGAFSFSPREAALLDPQARLFLECAHEGLEDAGHAPETFEGLIGVFGGVGANGYFMRNVLPAARRGDPAGAYQAMIANDKDFVPAWVAYKLDLRGPALAVQTSCSTSLVAVHLACQSLLAFECDMALAGGASIALEPRAGYLHEEGGILSPDGHCRPFDAAAQGTVRGSGAGIVVLRRLADAVGDGDRVVAVVRGSAVNNDGAVKLGFTAPGVDGQADVIALAQAVAGVGPDTIGLVEAHGTGTPLGDPIEVAALSRVFRKATTRRGFCALGSVKSNFGHLDAAAGVAGLMKAALSVEAGTIPPTVHFRAPNPKLELDASPFYVNAEARAWNSDGPRRAGVSSFGIGGTNAHVILEQAPAPRVAGASRPVQILALSARTPTALEAAADRLVDHFDERPDTDLADAAFTLAVGRRGLEYRRAVVAAGVEEAASALDTRDAARVWTSASPARERPVTLMFPGQGSQYPNMARELLDTEPVFREQIEACLRAVAPLLGFDLRQALFPGAADESDALRLARTEVTQPALFVVEYALARLVMSLGVRPQSLIGHSIGEYVAACLAGVFSLEDALAAVAARGRLMAEAPPGVMLAVSAPEADIQRLLPATGLSMAVVNAASACVVAGTEAAVAELLRELETRGIAHRRLSVSHAFHSHMMDGVLSAFRQELSRLTLRAPQIPFVSNVTGTWIRAEEATDPEYWVRQLRRTVYFADGVKEILKQPARLCLEVGPGRTLSTLCLQQRQSPEQVALSLLPDARDNRPASETLTTGLARAWVAGMAIDWRAYFHGETRNRVALPTYPFERERHWIDAPSPGAETPDAGQRLPIEAWLSVPAWRQAPRPAAAASAGRQLWLLVGGEELGGALASVLEGLGHHVLRAPERPAELPVVDRVVHLVGTGRGDALASLLDVFRALAERQDRPVLLDVVTRGVHSVTGDETVVPEIATLVGPCLASPWEMPHVRCRHIDVGVGDTLPLAQRLAAELIEEPDGRSIALRGRMRWALAYEAQAAGGGASSLKQGGVYWITGGLGGVGLTIAAHLATRAKARLVLTSRRAPDERALRAIDPLRASGVEVLVVPADVTRADDVARVVETLKARFGRLDGVVHAAGIAGGRLLARPAGAEAQAAMAAKVEGTRHVLGAADALGADWVVLCSSLASVLGGVGQADYAAANAYMDAEARARAGASGARVVSVNWDRWRDVGMAAAALTDLDAREWAIGPEEAPQVFEAALALGLPQIVVSTRPLTPRLSEARSPREPAAVERPQAAQARPILSTDYAEPGGERETLLAGLWRSVLGIERVGALDNFFELGGDSLTALSFTNLYRQATGRSLAVTALYQAPTIRALAASLEAELAASNPKVIER